jgi:hypothetical protein
MYNKFGEALNKFSAVLPEILQKNLPDVPPEYRELLCAMTLHALESLQLQMAQNGTAALNAVRLVFQLGNFLS